MLTSNANTGCLLFLISMQMLTINTNTGCLLLLISMQMLTINANTWCLQLLIFFKIRLRLAGQAIRHPELALSKVILWKLVHGQRGRRRPRVTFVKNLLIDTGVETTGELETLMLDRMVLTRVILNPRVAPADPP